METYNELIRRLADILSKAGVENAKNEARMLLSKAAGREDAWLLAHGMEPVVLSGASELFLDDLIQRRSEGEPLQYLLGEWDFFGRTFEVGKGVLIPRADTECVVEEALSTVDSLPSPTALDLCAGSGCISVTLALETGLRVTAVELSKEALAYLRKNVARMAPCVGVLGVDVLSRAEMCALPRVGLVVSNPPYIPRDDLAGLSREVQREPGMALDGGEDGLNFYRAICANPPLLPGGTLVFEVGIGQSEPVAALMRQNGFEKIHVRKDLGGIERAVSGRLNTKN